MVRPLAIVNEMAHVAIHDAFQPYALEFREAPAVELGNKHLWLASFRGGNAAGQILLAVEDALLSSLADSAGARSDLSRELTNVVAGALEAEFLRRGLAIRYTMPQPAADASLSSFDRGSHGMVCFLECPRGRVAVGIALNLSPGTVLELSPTRRLPKGFGPIDVAVVGSSSRCVLVVDDSATARAGVARTLSDAGFHVLEADSGAAALNLLRARADVRMVFTDLHMEGMQGAEFIKKLKADQGLAQISVVVLTASPSALSAVDKSQIVTCLFKPISPAAVISLTLRVLSKPS